jgi:probable phosphoglycerate mutase
MGTESMKVYAIRHGQTDMNAQERLLGCKSDPSLNDVGIRQAHEVAEMLKSMKIDLIITSPLRRATETTDIIAKQLGIKNDNIKIGEQLYERDFGDYEGELLSELNINALRRWTDNAPTPNGETIRELACRVFGFLDDELKKHNGKMVLFVVHGHVLRVMHWYFNGIPDSDEITLPKADNCEVYEFYKTLCGGTV